MRFIQTIAWIHLFYDKPGFKFLNFSKMNFNIILLSLVKRFLEITIKKVLFNADFLSHLA